MPLQPVPRFPSAEAERVGRLEEQVRTLQLDLTEERLRSTEIAKAQATASGNQTPLPPQVVEMIERQMETNTTMIQEQREQNRAQVEALKELIRAKA